MSKTPDSSGLTHSNKQTKIYVLVARYAQQMNLIQRRVQ